MSKKFTTNLPKDFLKKLTVDSIYLLVRNGNSVFITAGRKNLPKKLREQHSINLAQDGFKAKCNMLAQAGVVPSENVSCEYFLSIFR